MGIKRKLLAMACGCVLLAGGKAMAATVIYDSNGFENPPFQPGILDNQNAWDKVVTPDTGTPATATVQSGIGNPGQAVFVDHPAGAADTRWFHSVIFTPPPTESTVSVNWDMKVNQANTTASFGPFFGIEGVGGSNGTGTTLVAGALGVDATTGEVILEQGGTGFLTTTPTDTTVSLGSFHHFTLNFNYLTHTYDALVDGVLVNAAEPFVDPGITQFSDADIAALAAEDQPAGAAEAGNAVFDNYRITTSGVPEPASMGLVGFVGAALLGRRRARRTA